MDYVMAQEAGKKAAEYVIYRYPELFPGRQPVPVSNNVNQKVEHWNIYEVYTIHNIALYLFVLLL